jgi:ankyrin repeat protein
VQDHEKGWRLRDLAEAGDVGEVRALLEGPPPLDPDYVKGQYGKTALMLAALKGHREVVALLLHGGANPEAKDDHNWTALVHAANQGHWEVVALLLDWGANASARSNEGWTALTCAATRGHREMVALLLDRGADPSACTERGETALMSAAGNGHREVVALLLARGADATAHFKYKYADNMTENVEIKGLVQVRHSSRGGVVSS